MSHNASATLAIRTFLVAVSLLAVAGCVPESGGGVFQNGIHVATHVGAYSHPDAPETLAALRNHNIDWVQMVPFAWQLDTTRPELSFRDHTETQTAFIERVHRNGMHVMMKPHIWSPQFWGESGRWRGDIRMSSPEDWDRWFADYERFVLHYARMSERTGVEMFTLGLEYVQSTAERPEDWKRLIRKVRSVYSGLITYAAHYPDESGQIEFWEDLDYIGVVLYPELSTRSDPQLDDLLEGWKPVRENLHRMSEKFRRPVLIVEAGFNSIAGAGHRPWEWAREGSTIDLDLQARCYEATFRTFWNEPWIGGIYFWKWGIEAGGGGPGDIHYTPQGKPAAAVLRAWFGRVGESGSRSVSPAAGQP
jgi:hypothetical protein